MCQSTYPGKKRVIWPAPAADYAAVPVRELERAWKQSGQDDLHQCDCNPTAKAYHRSGCAYVFGVDWRRAATDAAGIIQGLLSVVSPGSTLTEKDILSTPEAQALSPGSQREGTLSLLTDFIEVRVNPVASITNGRHRIAAMADQGVTVDIPVVIEDPSSLERFTGLADSAWL